MDSERVQSVPKVKARAQTDKFFMVELPKK